jgi:hypothetical protein
MKQNKYKEDLRSFAVAFKTAGACLLTGGHLLELSTVPFVQQQSIQEQKCSYVIGCRKACTPILLSALRDQFKVA